MKRQIKAKPEEFDYWYPHPIIKEDVNAYEIVFTSKEDMTGYIMSVRVTRSDGVTVDDVGQINGKVATYTLKNNMYAIEGKVTIWVAITSDSGDYITHGTIEAEVISNGGEASISGDDRVPALTQIIIDVQQLHNQYSNMIAGLGGSPLAVVPELDYQELVTSGKYDPNTIYLVVAEQ